MTEIIDHIKQRVRARKFKYTLHARNEALNDKINISKTVEIIECAELIEDYPDDPRGHSCLLLGWMGITPVHVVCGVGPEEIIIITVYIPDSDKWIDYRERKKAP